MKETAVAIPPRLGGALESICLGLLLALAAVGAPFVLKYRSEGAVWLGYSSRYLLGVVLPAGAGVLGLGALALARERCAVIMERSLRWMPRPLMACAFAIAAAAALLYGYCISDEYVSVLMMIAAPGAVVVCWSVAARGVAGGPSLSSANLLLALLPWLACAIVLFALELPGLLSGSPLVVWGDTSTFAMLFPQAPPFIGSGGRLKPGLDVRMRAPEYPRGARLVTNARGFRNAVEFAEAAVDGELRVLSLGDSFSTGYCADQDRFFGALLERRLASGRTGVVSVMNAEVSDPAYGLYYLQQFGVAYRPGLVIYGLSGNDMMQAEQFSGEGRTFQLDADGRLAPNPNADIGLESAWVRYREFKYPRSRPGTSNIEDGPGILATTLSKLVRFRPFAALAAVAEREAGWPVDMPSYAREYEMADGHKRFIDGAANLGFYYRTPLEPVERMYAAAFELIAAMDRTTRQAGGLFLLVIYPQRYQVQPRDWSVLKDRWGLDDADFDLESANRRLDFFCRGSGVACCDLLEPFRAAAGRNNLFLPGGDTHINRHGHEAAAQAVAACLERPGS